MAMNIIKTFSNLFNTKKLNVNASNSTRNLAVAIAEASTTYSYDLTANPSGSFRGLNVDPLVRILSGAPTISQPLYGANLKVELNGTTGTSKTGGVFGINAYSLISGVGHTVDKNVGASILADVGNNLAGTTVSNNFSLEINGVASRTGTVITNSRSVVINCPNHGSDRRGLLISAEQVTGLAVGTSNISFHNLGTSRLEGQVTVNNNLIASSLQSPTLIPVQKSGTNIQGDNLILSPGNGTGNATYSSISFRGYPGSNPGSSGSTSHTSFEIAKFVRERFILAGFTLSGVSGDRDDGVSCFQVNGTSRFQNYLVKVDVVNESINVGSTTYLNTSVLLIDSTSSSITVSASAVSALTKGRVLTIKKIAGSNDVIFAPSSLVDGATNFILSALYSSVTVTNDGVNWFII